MSKAFVRIHLGPVSFTIHEKYYAELLTLMQKSLIGRGAPLGSWMTFESAAPLDSPLHLDLSSITVFYLVTDESREACKTWSAEQAILWATPEDEAESGDEWKR